MHIRPICICQKLGEAKVIINRIQKIIQLFQIPHYIKVRYLNHLVYTASPSDSLWGFFFFCGNDEGNTLPKLTSQIIFPIPR